MLDDPIERLSDDQLEYVLDHALKDEEHRLIKKTLDELERRGQLLEL